MTTKPKSEKANETIDEVIVKKIKCMARTKFTLNDTIVNANETIELTKEEYDGALFNKLVVKMED